MNENILLITVDSLRADAVGHLGEPQDDTPNIDAIAADGISCERAYANGIPTYFAFRSILGGRRDVLDESPIGLPPEWNTIADVFSAHGYDTAAFNAANPWLTTAFHYDSGFDTFVDFIDNESGTGAVTRLVEWMQDIQHRLPDNGLLRDRLGLAARTFCSITNNFPIESADEVTSRAVEWLSNHSGERPFFLWIHYMDPHFPWTPQADDVSSWNIANTWHKVAHIYNSSEQQPDSATIQDVRRLYSSEVSNVDSAIGELVDYIAQLNVTDNTIICFTADHGTELGDHGGFSHGPNSLYEEVVHVPFALSGPNVPQLTISEPVQHVDIPPTLVDVSNLETTIPDTEYGWAGTSLLQPGRDTALIQVIYEYNPAVDTTAHTGTLNAIVAYPWKLHWNEHLDSVELYNLADDPGETDDLSDSRPDIVDRLKRKIRSEQGDVDQDYRTAEELVNVRKTIAESDKL